MKIHQKRRTAARELLIAALENPGTVSRDKIFLACEILGIDQSDIIAKQYAVPVEPVPPGYYERTAQLIEQIKAGLLTNNK